VRYPRSRGNVNEAGFSYLGALSGIIKLNSSTGTTVLLVLMVNVIMLALDRGAADHLRRRTRLDAACH
jgi:hypothetical protein